MSFLRAGAARWLPIVIFSVLLAVPLRAQDLTPDIVPNPEATPASDAPSQPAASQPQSAPASTPPEKSKIHNGTSKDRLFFTLPNFQTLEDAGTLPPLTVGQKYGLVLRSAFDPVQFAWYSIVAGIGQGVNSEPSYGQGTVGYLKRYATAFGDGVMENFMVGAVLPSAFHQDPRFYQTSKGSFGHRLGYAMSRVLITRTDSGKQQFNYSEMLGSSMTAVIASYTYHPAEDRKLGNIASVWATQVGYDTLTNVIREFWPDMRRKMLKNKSQAFK